MNSIKFGKCSYFPDIEPDGLETLREIGAAWLEAKKEHLEYAINEGIISEVSYDHKK